MGGLEKWWLAVELIERFLDAERRVWFAVVDLVKALAT